MKTVDACRTGGVVRTKRAMCRTDTGVGVWAGAVEPRHASLGDRRKDAHMVLWLGLANGSVVTHARVEARMSRAVCVVPPARGGCVVRATMTED